MEVEQIIQLTILAIAVLYQIVIAIRQHKFNKITSILAEGKTAAEEIIKNEEEPNVMNAKETTQEVVIKQRACTIDVSEAEALELKNAIAPGAASATVRQFMSLLDNFIGGKKDV